MKIPPIVQVTIAAVLAWGLAKHFSVYDFNGATAQATALIFLILGTFLLTRSLYLFRIHATTFNPLEPSKAVKLVISGLYKVTRNPMYLGLAFLLLAFCLFLGELISLVCLPLFLWTMTRWQIIAEEEALTRKFGDDYLNYKKQVRRWL